MARQTEQVERGLWTAALEQGAMAAGWNLWLVDRDGLTRYEFQRLDQSPIFRTDDAALAYVLQNGNIDATAKAAISILLAQGLGAWPGQTLINWR